MSIHLAEEEKKKRDISTTLELVNVLCNKVDEVLDILNRILREVDDIKKRLDEIEERLS